MDCLKGMKQLKPNSIDLIVTDPPYNISQKGKKISRKNLSSKNHKRNQDIILDFGEWDNRSETDFLKFTKKWFGECARVLKPKGWFFSFFSKERIGHFVSPLNGLFQQHNFMCKTIITWHKTNPVPSFRKMSFLSACEFIVVGSKGNSKVPNFLLQKQMHNFFETPNSSIYGQTSHPTEKPLSLIEWLVSVGSHEDEVVLDPFMGSGTTAVACLNTKRKYIGFELNKDYWRIAVERVKPYMEQRKLTEMFFNTGGELSEA